jgi:O-antigen/teichoic acid export membrane protein
MRVIRTGLIYTAGNVASAAVPFALLPLLTRVLTPAEYGLVVAFSLATMICMPLAGLSVSGAVSVAWFNRPRSELPAFTGAALVVALSSTALTATAFGLLLAMTPALAWIAAPLWAALAAVTAGMTCLLQCRLGLWQSQFRPFSYVALQIAASVLNVALSLLFVLAFKWGAEGRNIGIVSSAFLIGCLAFAMLIWSGEATLRIRHADVGVLLRYGGPLIPHVFGGVFIGTADRWIVSAQLGQDSLGIYGVGAQLGMVMAVLADAFSKAYGPWLYGRLASTDARDKYSVVGAIYISAPAVLAVAAALGAALYLASSLLLGPQYRAATVVLPWFMLGGAFNGIYLCTTNLFFFSGRTSLLSVVTVTSAVAGTLLIWVLTSGFGIEGAAMGYAATQGLLALLVNVVASQSFDLPWREPRRALATWWSNVVAPERNLLLNKSVSPTSSQS